MVARARSGRLNSFSLAALVMLLSALASALAAGVALGALGLVLDRLSRDVLVIGMLSATLLGALSRSRPWQLDRETPTQWLGYRDWRTAALNGWALGLGFSTRIGFWLYYLIVVVAIWSHSILLAGAVFAVYGVSRVGLSLVQVAAGARVLTRMSTSLTAMLPMTEIALFLLGSYLLASPILDQGAR